MGKLGKKQGEYLLVNIILSLDLVCVYLLFTSNCRVVEMMEQFEGIIPYLCGA